MSKSNTKSRSRTRFFNIDEEASKYYPNNPVLLCSQSSSNNPTFNKIKHHTPKPQKGQGNITFRNIANH